MISPRAPVIVYLQICMLVQFASVEARSVRMSTSFYMMTGYSSVDPAVGKTLELSL